MKNQKTSIVPQTSSPQKKVDLFFVMMGLGLILDVVLFFFLREVKKRILPVHTAKRPYLIFGTFIYILVIYEFTKWGYQMDRKNNKEKKNPKIEELRKDKESFFEKPLSNNDEINLKREKLMRKKQIVQILETINVSIMLAITLMTHYVIPSLGILPNSLSILKLLNFIFLFLFLILFFYYDYVVYQKVNLEKEVTEYNKKENPPRRTNL
ncbi:MAG: hypothetical protein U9532_03800 ['Conium maculatum' witches'-broom phytoplasma]|nr:hypothetical protein ['Conium maculatum' witches'-broom phytoplasma]